VFPTAHLCFWLYYSLTWLYIQQLIVILHRLVLITDLETMSMNILTILSMMIIQRIDIDPISWWLFEAHIFISDTQSDALPWQYVEKQSKFSKSQLVESRLFNII